MAPKKKTPSTPTSADGTATLTPEEITRAALNDPDLSTRGISIGEKHFKILDLKYGDYLKFVRMITPLLKVFGKTKDLSVPGIPLAMGGFSVEALLTYCEDDLPKLACLVCNQTDPDITPEWLMENASPLKLANIVLAQLFQNNMIGEFADFFEQALPLFSLFGR